MQRTYIDSIDRYSPFLRQFEALADGATVETVDIPTATRRTLCLSSQAGCELACTFCVTGY